MKPLLRALFVLASLVCSPLFAAGAAPSIVFILEDDLGITDIGAYAEHFAGAKPAEQFYQMPHLDRLVRAGIPFSQSYANQLCSPTRAAVLTGRIASRLGVTTAMPITHTYHNQGMKVPDGYSPHDAFAHKDRIPGPLAWLNGHSNTAVDPALPTLPKVLATHRPAFIGKWHLGGLGAADRQPAAHGFEEIAYCDAGGSAYFNWQPGWVRATPHFKTMPGEFRFGKSGGAPKADYLTDDLSERKRPSEDLS